MPYDAKRRSLSPRLSPITEETSMPEADVDHYEHPSVVQMLYILVL